MGDPPPHQELALDHPKPADPPLEKTVSSDPAPSVSESREQTSTADQPMNPDVRLPDRPREVQQTQSAAKEVVSRTLKGKEKEWAAVAEKKGPLQLLDLPLDILREIVGHVSPHQMIRISEFAYSLIVATYERPHLLSIVSFRPSFAYNTLHILQIRHRLARAIRHRADESRRRCINIWTVNASHG